MEDVIEVPRAVFKETIRALEKIYAGNITMNNHAHRPWLLKRIENLRMCDKTEQDEICPDSGD